jgi:DNA helicase II / ATP-dependent DNA helicase PcrA
MARVSGEAFEKVYTSLNEAQRAAVDQIDGPVLVIAGPGTGKTQLLSARVANILQKTDTLPQNILCLTFTENGAANMRDRLTRFIGPAAYDVQISTYHAFGGDLIRKYPEYFAATRLQTPVDELGRRQVLEKIIDSLSFHNPLKQTRHHLGDLISTISEVKRALLNAESIRAIAQENTVFISGANKVVGRNFGSFTSMPRKVDQALPVFEQTQADLVKLVPEHPVDSQFGSLAYIALQELTQAITEATDTNKTTPLTKWKNNWLAKNSDNEFIFGGELENRRITALADVFEQYDAALEAHGWYDFDDMILRAVQTLESNNDLRFTLQERYLYLLLDEYQDTNASQAKLVELLTDNPVNEGRPNVMAVGDDDQAIYAFQGATYSNMRDFFERYRDVSVVNLTKNYRSHTDILRTAEGISGQIETRLHHQFEGMSKELVQSNDKLPPKATIGRREFLSDITQYDWTAREIKKLIERGTHPSEIAVLAPKHKQLEPLVAHLNALDIPVRYEKRENILDTEVVRQLVTMSKLVLALQHGDEDTANALWPEVLSFEFWQFPISEIWQMAWEVNDTRTTKGSSWSKALLKSDKFKNAALLMLALAARAESETCEVMLDYLIGTEEVRVNEPGVTSVWSPLRQFYTSSKMQELHPELFYDMLSHLTVLRAKFREYQATQDAALTLQDLVDFIAMYEAADERMLNTSPYAQQSDAVQLMTVFKAKGLEFAYVFLPCCQDDVWGGSSRVNTNKLTLPANLEPIRYAGATDDERLRMFFVAVTRAKVGLFLTSFSRTFSGKATRHLKYLDEREQEDGSFRSMILPEAVQTVVSDGNEAPQLDAIELDWRRRHIEGVSTAQLRGLLNNRVKNYRLSPTHLNSFIDMEHGGPESFFFKSILRFPEASSMESQFGSAIHETLEWVQYQVDEHGGLPSIYDVLQHFDFRIRHKRLSADRLRLELERGERVLTKYLSSRGHIFKKGDVAEHNFRNEGVFVGDVHMAGNIDRMEIDRANKTITVVDYKTGRSHAKWESSSKLHLYRHQLYCYKLLIEGSHTYQRFTVNTGRLEFIDSDSEARINTLELTFDKAELDRTRRLLAAMWEHVHNLNFPDTSSYDQTLSGIKQFEQDLLDGKI